MIRATLTLSYFFFQAEDGIRDTSVTGVQTCALPIWGRPGADDQAGNPAGPQVAEIPLSRDRRARLLRRGLAAVLRPLGFPARSGPVARSEERRVGKECRSGESAVKSTKKAVFLDDL